MGEGGFLGSIARYVGVDWLLQLVPGRLTVLAGGGGGSLKRTTLLASFREFYAEGRLAYGTCSTVISSAAASSRSTNQVQPVANKRADHLVFPSSTTLYGAIYLHI